jgi:hypothetical protein
MSATRGALAVPAPTSYSKAMQFLALRSDRPLPRQFQETFVPKLDVECYKCKALTYQLHAPILETEADQIQAQGEWLNAYLPKVCPDHHDYFFTPDRP